MTDALFAACAEAVHVIRPDGQLYRAGRAVLFILEHLGWGWSVRLLSYPPFLWLVEGLYQIVARHRSFFARFFFREE